MHFTTQCVLKLTALSAAGRWGADGRWLRLWQSIGWLESCCSWALSLTLRPPSHQYGVSSWWEWTIQLDTVRLFTKWQLPGPFSNQLAEFEGCDLHTICFITVFLNTVISSSSCLILILVFCFCFYLCGSVLLFFLLLYFLRKCRVVITRNRDVWGK